MRDKSLMPHLGSPIKPEATGNLYLKQCICCFRALLSGLVINQHTPLVLIALFIRTPASHGGAIFLIPTIKCLPVGETGNGMSRFFLNPTGEIILTNVSNHL